MATAEDTFNAMRDPKFSLRLTLCTYSDKDLETVLDELRTTLDEEPYIDDEGVSIYYSLTLAELTAEIFCLGCTYSRLEENHGIEHPFDYEVQVVY